jgi:hypothetical protein
LARRATDHYGKVVGRHVGREHVALDNVVAHIVGIALARVRIALVRPRNLESGLAEAKVEAARPRVQREDSRTLHDHIV